MTDRAGRPRPGPEPVNGRLTERLNGPPRRRPETTQDLAFWWDGLAAGELRIQRCTDCTTLRHPPLVRCAGCGSFEWDWIVAAGTGTLHSFVVYHAPVLPETSYPYALGLIELTEGTRVVLPLLPNDGAGLAIGIPMALRWSDDEPRWPCFAPREQP